MTTRTVHRWYRQPLDRHFWAFCYFCKRQGDRLHMVKHGDGTADLHVMLCPPDSDPRDTGEDG